MSLTKLSLAGNNKINPVQGELVSDIPAGDGKMPNLFLQYGCTVVFHTLLSVSCQVSAKFGTCTVGSKWDTF